MPVPDEELLFRTTEPRHTEGVRVLPGAMDPEGIQSILRQKYKGGPEACVPCKRKLETVVIATSGAAFPKDFTFDFRTIDLPSVEETAHAEIRPSKKGEGAWKKRLNNDKHIDLINDALSEIFSVVHALPDRTES